MDYSKELTLTLYHERVKIKYLLYNTKEMPSYHVWNEVYPFLCIGEQVRNIRNEKQSRKSAIFVSVREEQRAGSVHIQQRWSGGSTDLRLQRTDARRCSHSASVIDASRRPPLLSSDWTEAAHEREAGFFWSLQI